MLCSLLLSLLAFNSPIEPPPELSILSRVQSPVDDRSVDEIVEKGLETFDVPGAAVAIVVGNYYYFVNGYGLRDVETALPVTPETVFPIASCTKAMNAFILAQLQDEGRLSLDDPVVEHIPELRLWSEELTQSVTIRDMLAHRAGLPPHNVLYYATEPEQTSSDVVNSSFINRLQYLEPSAPVGTQFQYNNWMYTLSGIVAERTLGMSWEQIVKTRLLDPLGMESSDCSIVKVQQGENYAQPYARICGERMRVPFFNLSMLGGAGAINSSILDLAEWVRLQISNGTLNGRRYISEEALEETHTGQIPLGFPIPHSEYIPLEYSLGWVRSAFRGTTMLHHNGAPRGFRANIAFLPEYEIGVIVLSNSSDVGPNFVDSVSMEILDYMLGHNDIAWIEHFAHHHKLHGEKLRTMRAQKEAERIPDTSPSQPLASFAGTYSHPGYGEIEILYDGSQLIAHYGRVTVPLEHWHENTFETSLKTYDAAMAGQDFVFSENDAGIISELRVALEPALSPIVFTRIEIQSVIISSTAGERVSSIAPYSEGDPVLQV